MLRKKKKKATTPTWPERPDVETPPNEHHPHGIGSSSNYLYAKEMLKYPIVTTLNRSPDGEGEGEDDLSTMSPLTIPSVLYDGSVGCTTPTRRSRLGYRPGAAAGPSPGGGGCCDLPSIGEAGGNLVDLDDTVVPDEDDDAADGQHGAGGDAAATGDGSGSGSNRALLREWRDGEATKHHHQPYSPQQGYVVNSDGGDSQSVISDLHDEHHYTPTPRDVDDGSMHRCPAPPVNNNKDAAAAATAAAAAARQQGAPAVTSPAEVTAFPHHHHDDIDQQLSPNQNQVGQHPSSCYSPSDTATSGWISPEQTTQTDSFTDTDDGSSLDDGGGMVYSGRNDRGDDAISRAREEFDQQEEEERESRRYHDDDDDDDEIYEIDVGDEVVSQNDECDVYEIDVGDEAVSQNQASFDDAVSRVRDESFVGADSRGNEADEFDDAVSKVRSESYSESAPSPKGDDHDGDDDDDDDEFARVLSELLDGDFGGRQQQQLNQDAQEMRRGHGHQVAAQHHTTTSKDCVRDMNKVPSRASSSRTSSTKRTHNITTEAQRLNKLGAELLGKGRTEEALAVYRRAINSGRSDISRMKNRIVVHRAAQRGAGGVGGEDQIAKLNASIVSVAATVADVLNNMGVAYEMKCWYDAAISSCENALDMYVNTCHRRQDSNDPDVDRTLSNILQMEFARSTYDRRVTLHSKAEELGKRAASGTVDSTERRALMNERERLLTTALNLERDSLGPNHPAVAQTLLERGLLHRDMGNLAMSLKEVRHAVNIYRNSLGNSHPDFGRAIAKLAGVYELRDGSEIIESEGTTVETIDKDRALSLYRRATKVLRASIGNGPEVGAVLNNIGVIYNSRAEYRKAMEAFSAASAAYGGRSRQVRTAEGGWQKTSGADSGTPHHPDMAKVWNNIGEVLAKKKEWEKALDAFEFALVVIVQFKEESRQAAVQCGSGTSSRSSRVDSSHREIRRSSSDDISEVTTEDDLAPQAPRRNELEDDLLMAATLQNIGSVQCELGWHGKSMGSYEEALRITQMCAKNMKTDRHNGSRGRGGARQASVSMDTIRIFEKMGEVMENCGDLQAAMGLYGKCLSLHRTSGGDNYTAFASLLSKIASVHMKNCEYDEALEILQECVQLYRTNGLPRNHPELQKVNSLLTEAEQAVQLTVASMAGSSRNRSKSPASTITSGRSSQQSLSSKSKSTSGSVIDLAFAFDKKAEALRKAGNYDEAMEACIEALKIRRAKVAESEHASLGSGSSSGSRGGRNIEKIDLARSLRNMAFLHAKRKEYDRAKSLYTECIHIYKTNGLDYLHPYVETAMKELKALPNQTGRQEAPVRQRSRSASARKNRTKFMGRSTFKSK